MDEKPIPTWQKLLAVAYVVALVAEVAIWHTHLHADFIPFDHSNVAPNLLASVIIVEIVTPFGVLLWPPTRRRLHRFMDRKLEHTESLLEEVHHKLHTGQDHPRVTARLARGEHPTPSSRT